MTDGLRVDDVTVTFGGTTALSHVSMEGPVGAITGLIGPNGAGKSTTFNVCSGLLRPRSGAVHLFGQDVTGSSPAARAQAGLGRTFQRVELAEVLTVRENVLVGAEARRAGARPWRQLVGGRSTSVLQHRTDAAVERCGLGDLADHPVRTLSTGQRRLVELARAIAGGYQLLLLDEPSSGLDDRETERFGVLLTGLVADAGVGIVLVEHDMGLVLGVCSQIYVLEFGTLIFHGSPAETRASEIVRAAYLGSEVHP